MPKSKNRKPHHHQSHPPVARKSEDKNRLLIVAIIFLALLGMGIAWFASNNLLVLALGAVIGGVCGYFFGKLIERSISNR